ncbi:MAG: hypothetical protein ACQES2_09610 [Pseudomonadota bacterium]
MTTSKIDELVQQYLDENPDYEYPPSGNKHPSILSMTYDMKPWIIDQLGGIEAYWKEMLHSAMIWFEPGEGTPEYRVFCMRFEGEGNIFWQDDPELEKLIEEYSRWKKSKTSETD